MWKGSVGRYIGGTRRGRGRTRRDGFGRNRFAIERNMIVLTHVIVPIFSPVQIGNSISHDQVHTPSLEIANVFKLYRKVETVPPPHLRTGTQRGSGYWYRG